MQGIVLRGVPQIYIAGNAEGYSKGSLIEIEETLDTPARCGVIAHEIGHELMHRTNREGTTHQQRELEAESVSYAVLAHFGIHSESRFYLATYDVTAEMLTASLQTIGNAAKRIISLIENSGEHIEEGEGEQYPPRSPPPPRRASCPRENAATLPAKGKGRPNPFLPGPFRACYETLRPHIVFMVV